MRADAIGADAIRPKTPEKPGRHVSLPDCIDIAIRSNLNLAVQRINAVSTREDIEIARSVFDPVFFTRAGRNAGQGLRGSPDTTASRARTGIAMRTITGATVEVAGDTSKTETESATIETVPIYDSRAELTIRQPLLKGAGIHVNRIPIEISRIFASQAELELRRSVLDVLQNTENAFWRLVFAIRQKEVREKTLANAQRLIEETKARVKVGLATAVDSLQAEAALASRREALVLSRQEIEDRTDALLLFLGKLGREKLTILIPDRFPPAPRTTILDNEKALDAIRRLPEYAIQLQVIKGRRLLVDKARNDRLPSVDLTAGGGYVGEGPGFGSSFDNAFRRSNQDWSILLELRIPLGFREERAALAKSRYALEIENLRFRQLEQLLHEQIRTASRSTRTGAERVKVTGVALRLNEEQYEQVFGKFKEGLSTFREMLFSQDDLDDARLASLRAQLDAVQAAIRLARLDGTLLPRHYMEWATP